MSYVAEQNLIGCLLIDCKALDDIYGIVEPQMFTSNLFGQMYNEFLRGYDRNYEVNLVVLVQKIKSEIITEQQIMDVVKECMGSVITSATIKSYADVIVKDYKAKEFSLLINKTQPNPNNVDTQIAECITQLEALQTSETVTSKSLAEIVKSNKDKYFRPNDRPKLFFGLKVLDELIGGLEPGDVTIIGARPAVGKSAFVTQLSKKFALDKKRVGFYNLEMSDTQMYERFAASESGIDLTRIRRAINFCGSEKNNFDRANETLGQLDNLVISTGSKTMSQIRAESRHMNYDIIIIDYLQLIKADKGERYNGNRVAEVGAISKAIKALAMELHIPIIALSQLNRATEHTETKEPTMADLREAGDIEQDASIIILLWNILEDDKSKKGCKVEKQRMGDTGKEALDFDGKHMKFCELQESIKDIQKSAKGKADYDCPFPKNSKKRKSYDDFDYSQKEIPF